MKPLTQRDLETLDEIIAAYDQALLVGRNPEHGVAPLDFGGHDASHHSATATKLAARGMIEQKYRGLGWGEKPKRSRWRGSKVYRPTPAGRQAVSEWRRERASD